MSVINETDQPIVADYLLDESLGGPREVLRLGADDERGSFGPYPFEDDNCLIAPVVVRTLPDDRIAARAPAGACFTYGLRLVAR